MLPSTTSEALFSVSNNNNNNNNSNAVNCTDIRNDQGFSFAFSSNERRQHSLQGGYDYSHNHRLAAFQSQCLPSSSSSALFSQQNCHYNSNTNYLLPPPQHQQTASNLPLFGSTGRSAFMPPPLMATPNVSLQQMRLTTSPLLMAETPLSSSAAQLATTAQKIAAVSSYFSLTHNNTSMIQANGVKKQHHHNTSDSSGMHAGSSSFFPPTSSSHHPQDTEKLNSLTGVSHQLQQQQQQYRQETPSLNYHCYDYNNHHQQILCTAAAAAAAVQAQQHNPSQLMMLQNGAAFMGAAAAAAAAAAANFQQQTFPSASNSSALGVSNQQQSHISEIDTVVSRSLFFHEQQQSTCGASNTAITATGLTASAAIQNRPFNRISQEQQQNLVNANHCHIRQHHQQQQQQQHSRSLMLPMAAGNVNSAPKSAKVYRCHECNYTSDRKNNLKRHYHTMHEVSEQLLECCAMRFACKASLRMHTVTFHKHGYRCHYCSRNFCRKALLRRHLTVHTGQRDYQCALCRYATSHRSNLERHRRVHHKVEEADDTELVRSNAQKRIDFRDANFETASSSSTPSVAEDDPDQDDPLRERASKYAVEHSASFNISHTGQQLSTTALNKACLNDNKKPAFVSITSTHLASGSNNDVARNGGATTRRHHHSDETLTSIQSVAAAALQAVALQQLQDQSQPQSERQFFTPTTGYAMGPFSPAF